MNRLKNLLTCSLGLFALQSMGQNAVDFTVKAPQRGIIFAQDTFYYCGGKKVLLKRSINYKNFKGE